MNGADRGEYVVKWTEVLFVTFHKAQVQVDQGPPHKSRETDTYWRESVEEPLAYGHRGKIPEQNTYGLCYKIKNWQMGHHKFAKLL